jgi:DNA-binding FadR family transcriptional regulator
MAVQFYAGATAAVFTPLESLSRAELVARRLMDAIALGLLTDGEQLPGETDLGVLLGVSTVTVREALQTLRMHGLIETRRGRGGGSFVHAPSGVSEKLVRDRLVGLSLLELRDLGDQYAGVAGMAAKLAAERAASEDVARLTRSAEALASASEPSARRRADGQFHIEVAVAAQSRRLYREEIELQAEFGALLWIAFDDDPTHAELVRSAHAVVDAIAAGDADQARREAEDRVAFTTGRLVDLRLKLED